MCTVSQRMTDSWKDKDEKGFHIIGHPSSGGPCALPGLSVDSTLQDLLDLVNSRWGTNIEAVILGDQKVTQLQQALHAYGLVALRCLLVVREVGVRKLEGGMQNDGEPSSSPLNATL